VISGFRSKVDENCDLLGYYAAYSGNFLSTFRGNLTVPSSGVENPRGLKFGPFKIEPIGCPETSVINYYYYSLRNNPEERSSLKPSVARSEEKLGK
jgi:hypothetical protein